MTYLNAICVSLDNAGLTDAAKNQNNCLKNNSSNHSGSEQLHIHSETHKQGVYILKKRHIKTHTLTVEGLQRIWQFCICLLSFH